MEEKMWSDDAAARVFVVGLGRVGAALLHALREAGVPCDGQDRPATTGAPFAADAVVLAVPDAAIAEVAAALAGAGRLAAPHVVLHCAGAHPASEMLGGLHGRVRAVGTLHPLRSFAAAVPTPLRGVAFGLEGDAEARALGRALVARLGGIPVEVDAAALPLYHAAAVMASNYVVALCDAAADLLVRAAPGAAPLPTLLPLVASALGALQREGLPGALTGPLARGDAGTVRSHLEALASRAPELLPLYRACGLRAADLADRQGQADPAGLAAARRALEEGAPGR
jgi:predicted short-subunit dehydrogenase-like oxidoreductase (DUF2520 family)